MLGTHCPTWICWYVECTADHLVLKRRLNCAHSCQLDALLAAGLTEPCHSIQSFMKISDDLFKCMSAVKYMTMLPMHIDATWHPGPPDYSLKPGPLRQDGTAAVTHGSKKRGHMAAEADGGEPAGDMCRMPCSSWPLGCCTPWHHAASPAAPNKSASIRFKAGPRMASSAPGSAFYTSAEPF